MKPERYTGSDVMHELKHIPLHMRKPELVTEIKQRKGVAGSLILSTSVVFGLGSFLLHFIPLTTVLPTCAPIWACLFTLMYRR